MSGQPVPSAFSVYASRFLAGNVAQNEPLFRPPSPTSPSHDPFLSSPSASRSHPHLRGSSRSPSPSQTPPFPGPGIDAIPDIDEGLGMLFATEEDIHPAHPARVPNPYAESVSSLEADLDEVAAIRKQESSTSGVPPRKSKGWMAHQSVFPPSSSSSSSETDEDGDEYSAEDAPQLEEPLLSPDQLDAHRGAIGKVPVRLQVYHGRFGHWEREGLRKYKDSAYLALWLTTNLVVLIGLFFVWGATDAPPDSRPRPSVIPLLPLLFVLLIPAIVLPIIFLFLLRRTVRPVLLATAVAIPFSLFVCGWWAFAASFESFESPDRWWGTTGLRICAVLLWATAGLFARLVWIRRKRMERTAAVVELSTHLLLTHPPLLLLTPILLGVFALLSIPYLTLLVRLGMIGYWRHPREGTWVFQIRPYAGWLIVLVTLAWVWTWGVVRGVGRVAVAGVVGEWYFHRASQTHPSTLEITTAAVHRATGTSFGSVCLGAGIVAVFRVVGGAALKLKQLTPRSKGTPLAFVGSLTPLFALIAGVLDQLNGYALVYVGITGDAFWPSARRAVGLAGRRRGSHLLDYTLIKLLLTLSSTAMGLFTATAGYLYMSHSLGNPSYAPIAGMLCGGVPFLAVRSGAAVLGDAADALFICYQIDRETGSDHCDEAKQVFGEKRSDVAV